MRVWCRSYAARVELADRDAGIDLAELLAAFSLATDLGLSRGVLSGRHRFGAVGVQLVLENGLRCVVAGALMAAGNDQPAAYGLALLAGYAAMLLRPSALVPRATG